MTMRLRFETVAKTALFTFMSLLSHLIYLITTDLHIMTVISRSFCNNHSSHICNMSTKMSRQSNQQSLVEYSELETESNSENCFIKRLIFLTRQMFEINVSKQAKRKRNLKNFCICNTTRNTTNHLVSGLMDCNTSGTFKLDHVSKSIQQDPTGRIVFQVLWSSKFHFLFQFENIYNLRYRNKHNHTRCRCICHAEDVSRITGISRC